MRMMACAVALLGAVPVMAQEATVVPAPAGVPTAAPASDPARLAAAGPVIDALFPLGSYERLMRGTMDQMMDSILTGVTGMTPRQIGVEDAGEEADVPLGQVIADVDPAFDERLRLSSKVMMDEMIALMTEVEPAVRTALTQSFARRYTVGQLGEMNAFFATPTGAVFARDYLATFTDPEMMAAMQAFVPRIMERMPAMIQKVDAATAHLPKPGDVDGSVGDEESGSIVDDVEEDVYDQDRWSDRDRRRYAEMEARLSKLSAQLLAIEEEAAARARRSSETGS